MLPTVLYVDDEEAIRRAIRSWLVRRGHTVFTAGSADEAIGVLESNAVDGVIIDIWLGAESGFDLFDAIATRWPTQARNVVFVTGDIDPETDVASLLAAAGRPVLTKPFELGELERTMIAWTAP
jgi:two-component system OmpR family response regulator